MSVLSAQSIRRLCSPEWRARAKGIFQPHDQMHAAVWTSADPLITPFTERGVVNGKSYGLSGCSYDVRIAEDLILEPGQTALVSTIEAFNFPHNVCASVVDKSTYARKFVSAFNTHFDAGFCGHATIELANLGGETVVYQRGDPVCQFKFEWLDDPTDLPYRGKYQNQPARPVAAISEEG